MLTKTNTTIEQIIAKIDNDFNPDNSDWIPRVGAWCIDVMSQLNVTPTKTKVIKVPVKDRIAYTECNIDNTDIKVYDKNKCEIKELKDNDCCNVDSSTGDLTKANTVELSDTINVSINDNNSFNVIAETINDKTPYRYNIHEIKYNKDTSKNYVIIDCNKLELNFDTDYIYIKLEYIETVCSEVYGCELPVIPNNGILIEAMVYYCMYKMLCRGYKHPIFNLSASQYGTNPYYMWITIKEEAKRSVINNNINVDDISSKMFNSNFYLQTFQPKD